MGVTRLQPHTALHDDQQRDTVPSRPAAQLGLTPGWAQDAAHAPGRCQINGAGEGWEALPCSDPLIPKPFLIETQYLTKPGSVQLGGGGWGTCIPPAPLPTAGCCQPGVHFSGLRNASPWAFMGSVGAGEEPGSGLVASGDAGSPGLAARVPVSLSLWQAWAHSSHWPYTPCLGFPTVEGLGAIRSGMMNRKEEEKKKKKGEMLKETLSR